VLYFCRIATFGNGSYDVDRDIQLFFGIAVLIFALMVASAGAFLFGRMTKPLGVSLIAIYSLFLVGSVVLEVTN
jgi:hypothetical protein